MTRIKAHGTWQPYEPETRPPTAPGGVLFARRIADGVDWYDYVADPESFSPDSVKLTVIDGIVRAATVDATRLWPGGGATVLEVFDAGAGDPQAAFGNKVYDADTEGFIAPGAHS